MTMQWVSKEADPLVGRLFIIVMAMQYIVLGTLLALDRTAALVFPGPVASCVGSQVLFLDTKNVVLYTVVLYCTLDAG